MEQTTHDNMDHKKIIIDADPCLTIDTDTGNITCDSSFKKIALVQYDHNCERFSFTMKKDVEGHDITLCNRVQIHYVNVTGSSRTKHIGLYEVTDLAVDSENNEYATFSWLISENATHYEGTLSFLISFECVDKDDTNDEVEVLYRWNTRICSAVTIVPGLNNNNAVYEDYVDELLKWENYLETHFDKLEAELENTIIPTMVDQRYIDRDFATSAEVAEIFAMDAGDAEDSTTAGGVTNLIDGAGEKSLKQVSASQANGANSFAAGLSTNAEYEEQVAIGRFNDSKSYTLFEVGNGTDNNNRKNALEVLRDGRLKVQSEPTEDNDVLRFQDVNNIPEVDIKLIF